MGCVGVPHLKFRKGERPPLPIKGGLLPLVEGEEMDMGLISSKERGPNPFGKF